MRRYAILLAAVLAATACVRLGIWQLDRLEERRTRNATIAQRLAVPEIDLGSDQRSVVFAGSDSIRYRRAGARGTFDFKRELVVMARVHRGVPGAYVVTPLVMAGDTAVLVERGWAPAPDGRAVQLSVLLEPEAAEVEGILMPPPETGLVFDVEDGWPLFVRGVDPRVLAEQYGYVLLPLVLRRTGSAESLPADMRPIPLPELTNGPHLSYAMQWFSFAAIALVGSTILFVRFGGKREARVEP